MRLRFIIVAAIAVSVMAAAYLLSPLSQRTNALRILVETKAESGATRYEAVVVNDGYLPVFVGRCETVSDVMQRDVRVGDVLQRWQPESGRWETVLDRHHCQLIVTGIIEARFTRKLLWPTQRLHTSPFFPNIGFQGLPFQHGNRVRFLVLMRTPKQDSEALSSPGFTVD